MIGTKLYKNNKDDMAKYTKTAIWCNSNNAHIEDKGSYYEVCENVVPTPTKEEQLAQLVAQYESDKAEILKYYADAMIHGDSDLMAELKEEMTALDEQYATDYEALKGDE
jgi:septal ring factor EnvC (AmiA/AmiB activator)